MSSGEVRILHLVRGSPEVHTPVMERNSEALQHEDGLALFIEPGWRSRFRSAMGSPSRRAKVLSQLDHFRHLDERFATPVPASRQTLAYLETELRRRGATSLVHVVSEVRELDGEQMTLGEALGAVLEHELGSFVSCIPGRLAYFHEEEYGNRHILQRRD